MFAPPANIARLRQDLCAATETEFEEIIASESNRSVQRMIKETYKCHLAISLLSVSAQNGPYHVSGNGYPQILR
jgi:hypothetical protein